MQLAKAASLNAQFSPNSDALRLQLREMSIGSIYYISVLYSFCHSFFVSLRSPFFEFAY